MAITCAYCCKSMSRYDEYICCRNTCGKNYHISCVSISEAQYVAMKSDGTVKSWSCEDCVNNLTSGERQLDQGVATEPAIKQIISQKVDEAVRNITNTIISTLQIEMNKLFNENKKMRAEIEQLKCSLKKQQSVRCLTEETEIQDGSDIDRNKKTTNKKPRNTLPSITTYADVAKKNAEQKNIERISQQRNQTENGNESQFTTVINRKRKRNIIQGTASNGSSIKGAERYAHLHIYGLDVHTSIADIEKHLEENKILNCKCEQLQSRRPTEYSSFKISCKMEELDKIKSPDLWPMGVKLNRFFFTVQQKIRTT